MEQKAKYSFVEWLAAKEGDDFNIIEPGWLEFYKKFVHITPDMIHEGDCTNIPSPCHLCVMETLLNEYREYYFGRKPETELKQIKDNLAEPLEWMAMLYFQLHELVELKKLKDTEGKTEDYLDRQPKAWHGANMVLDLWKQSDYGAIPMKPISEHKKDEALYFAQWKDKEYAYLGEDKYCDAYDEQFPRNIKTLAQVYSHFKEEINNFNNTANGTT